ncbi:MAG: hypothetical protein ABII90_10245 [Bacteroidota bacterium]
MIDYSTFGIVVIVITPVISIAITYGIMRTRILDNTNRIEKKVNKETCTQVQINFTNSFKSLEEKLDLVVTLIRNGYKK